MTVSAGGWHISKKMIPTLYMSTFWKEGEREEWMGAGVGEREKGGKKREGEERGEGGGREGRGERGGGEGEEVSAVMRENRLETRNQLPHIVKPRAYRLLRRRGHATPIHQNPSVRSKNSKRTFEF
jgi:hypothetical protein